MAEAGQQPQADMGRLLCVQMGVFQYAFPGVIRLAEDAIEAVIIYMYIKGLRHKDIVTFRGIMFAQVPFLCIHAILA